jgi:hypothetical protein
MDRALAAAPGQGKMEQIEEKREAGETKEPGGDLSKPERVSIHETRPPMAPTDAPQPIHLAGAREVFLDALGCSCFLEHPTASRPTVDA